MKFPAQNPLFLTAFVLSAACFLSVQAAPRPTTGGKISTIDLGKMFPDPDQRGVDFIGINRANEVVVDDYYNHNVSSVVTIPIRNTQKPTTSKNDDDDTDTFVFSADGKELFVVPSLVGAHTPSNQLNASQLKIYDIRSNKSSVIETGMHRNLDTLHPSPFNPDWIAMTLAEDHWSAEDKDWVGGEPEYEYVEVWNWKTEKRVFRIHYPNARSSVNEIQLTPDGKRMALMYLSPFAENPSRQRGEGEDDSPAGSLASVDPRSGRVAWNFQEKSGKMRRPVFFLSNSQIVVRNLKFDLDRKRMTPLFVRGPKEPRLDCVGAVPGVLNRAFFLTKNGLELWNVSGKKSLHRWTGIRKAEQVSLTPDHSILSVRNGWKFDFYPFQSSWLKSR